MFLLTLFSSLWSATRRKSSLSWSESFVCERLPTPVTGVAIHTVIIPGWPHCLHSLPWHGQPTFTLPIQLLSGTSCNGKKHWQAASTYGWIYTIHRCSALVLALDFSIPWCRKKPDQEANFLDEKKEKVIGWSPKVLDFPLVFEDCYGVYPVFLHV